MNCKDLMKMKQIQSGMKLQAGENGLDHVIRWIYFADCIQCLSGTVNAADLIHGEELVIVTDQKLTCDDKKLIDMIKSMREKYIAGFVINEGQISESTRDYCNKTDLPLFELSVNLHLVDLSQLICKALVEEESNANSREHIFSSILYSENLNTLEIIGQAEYFGIYLKGQYRVLQFCILEECIGQNSIQNKKDSIQIRENIKRIIRNEFALHGLQQMLLLFQVDTILALVPVDSFNNDLLSKVISAIIVKVEKRYSVSLLAGAGMPYEYIEDFRTSYHEAQSAVKLCKIAGNRQNVLFYENSGIYFLITQIHNEKLLNQYVQSHIGKLIKADQIQHGDLCRTLECYLDNNCNANTTAEILCIHRNTMHYRLDKIRQILGTELNNMAVLLELELAFDIKRINRTAEIPPVV
jgi:sugar diacid utilization regulator